MIFCYNNKIKSLPLCKFCLEKYVKFYYSNNKYWITCWKQCWQYYRNSNWLNINELKNRIKLESNFNLNLNNKNISELIYLYNNKLKKRPICKFCNKEIKYNWRSYSKFCNNSCVAHYTLSKNQSKQYLINNYPLINSLRWKIYCHNNKITTTPICHCSKKKVFSIDRFIYKGCNNSKWENELFIFIKSIYDWLIIRNDRKILKGKELDIFIPWKNLAIEYNWEYYNSEIIDSKENKERHITKTNNCEKLWIQLLHINEREWKDKNL